MNGKKYQCENYSHSHLFFIVALWILLFFFFPHTFILLLLPFKHVLLFFSVFLKPFFARQFKIDIASKPWVEIAHEAFPHSLIIFLNRNFHNAVRATFAKHFLEIYPRAIPVIACSLIIIFQFPFHLPQNKWNTPLPKFSENPYRVIVLSRVTVA